MDRKELELIQKLMDELQEKMQYGKEDFEERLGRKKPEIEVMKIEGKVPLGESDDEEDSEHFERVEEEPKDMEPSSPEEELKKRLMKLRG